MRKILNEEIQLLFQREKGQGLKVLTQFGKVHREVLRSISTGIGLKKQGNRMFFREVLKEISLPFRVEKELGLKAQPLFKKV